jgi:hypothetical protein
MDLKVHGYLQQQVDNGQSFYENTKHEEWTVEAHYMGFRRVKCFVGGDQSRS